MRELGLPFYRSRTSVAHPQARLTLPQPSWAAVIVVTATVAGLTWGLMQQRVPDIDPRQVIAINLAAAKLAMEDERFVDPPERSALHYYATVLALDATNADAVRGVDRIAARYIETAKQAIIEDRFADAVTAMDTVRRVQPNHARLVFLETELRKSLERRVFVLRAELAAAQANATNEPLAVRPPTKAKAARAEAGERLVPAKAPASNAMDRTTPAAVHEQRGDTQAAGASTSELELLVESLDREQRERERANGSDTVPNASAYDLIDAAYRRVTRHMIEAPVVPADAISQRPRISPRVQTPAVASAPGASAAAPASSVSSTDPKVVRWVPPKYPQSALVRGIEGWVDLLVVISPSGDVAEAIVQDRSGSRSFERAALAAARQWKYEPRAPGDTSVRDRVPVRVAFKLEEE